MDGEVNLSPNTFSYKKENRIEMSASGIVRIRIVNLL